MSSHNLVKRNSFNSFDTAGKLTTHNASIGSCYRRKLL